MGLAFFQREREQRKSKSNKAEVKQENKALESKKRKPKKA